MAEIIVEPGAAFERLSGLERKPAERFDVIVIGGGQTGLSVGYHLKQKGLRFVILDAQPRIGDAWRKRWDTLRLFTPAWLDGLDGMPFPGPSDAFPTKDEMADYLERYAAHFALPVRNSCKVERLSKQDGRFVVECGDTTLHADQVIVAMARYQKQRVPEFARELRADIVQLHSTDYKNAAQLAPGAAMLVGGGNSGAEIALDLSRTHAVSIVGPDVGAVPFSMRSRLFAFLLMRVFFHRILTIRTALGRKLRPKMLVSATPLIRTKPTDLRAAGVDLIAQRVTGVRDGLPLLADGRVLDVKNIVWCTGFNAGHAWIDLPIFDQRGEPQHEAGVAREPGLYFVGLHFLFSMSSSMVHGVGRDAQRIAGLAAARATAAVQPRSAGAQPSTKAVSRQLGDAVG